MHSTLYRDAISSPLILAQARAQQEAERQAAAGRSAQDRATQERPQREKTARGVVEDQTPCV